MEKSSQTKKDIEFESDKNSELGQPYVFEIENTSDDKLYEVKVFDEKFQTSKVKYTYGLSGVTYVNFLAARSLNHVEDICRLKVVVYGDYAKFVNKQVTSAIAITQLNINGSGTMEMINPSLDVYQQVTNYVIVDHNFKIEQMSNIVFAYLMPEIKIKLFLYPKKINYEL